MVGERREATQASSHKATTTSEWTGLFCHKFPCAFGCATESSRLVYPCAILTQSSMLPGPFFGCCDLDSMYTSLGYHLRTHMNQINLESPKRALDRTLRKNPRPALRRQVGGVVVRHETSIRLQGHENNSTTLVSLKVRSLFDVFFGLQTWIAAVLPTKLRNAQRQDCFSRYKLVGCSSTVCETHATTEAERANGKACSSDFRQPRRTPSSFWSTFNAWWENQK